MADSFLSQKLPIFCMQSQVVGFPLLGTGELFNTLTIPLILCVQVNFGFLQQPIQVGYYFLERNQVLKLVERWQEAAWALQPEVAGWWAS